MNLQSKKTQKIKEILRQAGVEIVIKEFPDSTHTARDAANVIGCELGQIAKSLIFKGQKSGRPVLVIASGQNRVDEKKIKNFLNEEIGKADADFVLEKTGFAIGGIPPFGHSSPITTIIDKDLLQYDEIWAAAGTANSVFKIKPQDLTKITGAEILDLKP